MTMRELYEPFIFSQADCLVEILDDFGSPFMVMSLGQAFRQGLRYQLALCLLYDRHGSLYLFQRSKQSPFFPDLWDVPLAVVRAGESPFDTVIDGLYSSLRVRPSSCVEICREAGASFQGSPDFLTFQALAPSQTPAPDSPDIDQLVCVDEKDFQVLLKDFPDQISPPLRYVGERALAFRV